MVGTDRTGRRSMGAGIVSRRGMVTINFNPVWHVDRDYFRWTSCSALGGGRGRARFGFPEYRVWFDLQRDVAWTFRGSKAMHGTWNELQREVFPKKRALKRQGSVAWGVHP